MKRILCFSLFLLLSVTIIAQTQQGIVKTRGKMANGVLKRGTPLSGATIQIKDRSAMVSDSNGIFSFPLRTNSYLLQNVKKNGYQLVDMDACRVYKYSTCPLYIVMETPEQHSEDKLAAERKIRRTLQRQLQQRENELEELKAQNKLTQEEYRKALQQLYDDQQNNEKLIADMAKKYAEMDFDQMDELNRQISDCILNGELTKADSLLRSKGDINERNAEIDRRLKAEAQEKVELAQRQQNLEASEIGTKKLLEDFAEDCLKYHNMFKLENKHDSALYYIELRAQRDTTNVEWQNQTGNYIADYLGNYSHALNYFQRVLRQSLLQYGEESEWAGKGYNSLGVVYDNLGDYAKALEYYQKTLTISEKMWGAEHHNTATSYNNIGIVYGELADYNKALEYLQKAQALREKELGSEHPDVATSYNNIGIVYSLLDDHAKALEYYQKALAIRKKVLGEDHLDMAQSYSNIGIEYSQLDAHTKALEYYQKALVIQEEVLGAEHPSVANSWVGIGNVYSCKGDYAKAMEYYQKALAIGEKVLGVDHPSMANLYENIGGVYYYQDDYVKALEFFQKALAIHEKVLGPEHPNTKVLKENIEYLRQKLSKPTG